MLIGELLDSGGRGTAQAILGATLVVLVLLGTALLVPVLILTSLLPTATNPISTVVSAVPALPFRPGLEAPAGGSASPTASNVSLPSPAGSEIIDVARHYLGVPYVFGGTNPASGLDCSGLVQLVYRQVGIALPRTAQQQYEATGRVSRADLQPGDLVFFARTYADPHDWVTHVGIYIGDGLQINAPTEGKTVSIQPVFSGFWGEHFTSGGRPRR